MRTFLADRLVILGSKPGRIRGELEINLPRAHIQSTLFFVLYTYTGTDHDEPTITQLVDEQSIAQIPSPAPGKGNHATFKINKLCPHLRRHLSWANFSWTTPCGLGGVRYSKMDR